MVFLRSSWDDDAAFLGMRCGAPLGRRVTEEVLLENRLPDWRPGTGHVHPDINALLIHNRGEALAIDTGYTLRKWTRDHNTIAIDGGGQIGEDQAWPRYEPWDRYGRIGEFFAGPRCWTYVRGEGARAYQPELGLTQFDRHVMFVDRDYFLVFDQLAAEKPHRYEWLLHSVDQAQESGDAYVVTQGRECLSVRVLLPRDPVVVQEDAVVSPTPWRPDRTHRGKRLRLGAPQKSKATEFLTVLSLHGVDETPPEVRLIAEDDALGACVAWGDWNDVLLVRSHGAGIGTDAPRSFVRVGADGKVLRWAMTGGTRLAWHGEALIQADVPLSCALRVVAPPGAGPTGVAGVLECSARTALTVSAPGAIVSVRVDGRDAVKGDEIPDTKASWRLEAGRHDVWVRF